MRLWVTGMVPGEAIPVDARRSSVERVVPGGVGEEDAELPQFSGMSLESAASTSDQVGRTTY
jgi:hypothetical protein